MSDLPHVNGDVIFGAFIFFWASLVLQQTLNPLPMLSFERLMVDIDGNPKISPELIMENFWVPGLCTFLYFTMLLQLPNFMKNRDRPAWLKKVAFFWNIVLSSCSSWACSRIAGPVVALLGVHRSSTLESNGVQTSTFYDLVCDMDSTNTCKREQVMCSYLMLFCMSKIPEMIDTLMLILAKKKVIFLHWFHHSSVMWFCWLAWAYTVPMGIIFALMNLSVHSLMYAWYALAAADRWLATGLKPKRFFSQTVTVLQIIQMILGMTLTIYVHGRKDCGNPKSVTSYALAMYGVYLLLFIQFFYRAYCKKRKATMIKQSPTKKQVHDPCSWEKSPDVKFIGAKCQTEALANN